VVIVGKIGLGMACGFEMGVGTTDRSEGSLAGVLICIALTGTGMEFVIFKVRMLASLALIALEIGFMLGSYISETVNAASETTAEEWRRAEEAMDEADRDIEVEKGR
jgi:hypothetical protein